jgi:hypothetical protein
MSKRLPHIEVRFYEGNGSRCEDIGSVSINGKHFYGGRGLSRAYHALTRPALIIFWPRKNRRSK